MSIDYSDFTVVLPTLNEEKNVGSLLRTLLKEYSGIRILVVDDGSVDNTRKVVGAISKANRNVRFIDRSSRSVKGLTASAAEGIVLSRSRFAIVMDADLQHPPQAVGRIASKLCTGSDLVVAVRASVQGWELYRKLISKSLIGIGYAILAVRGRARCGDIFSGFFGVDRNLFSRTYSSNKKRFVGGGYKVLYDFLKCNGINEISISEVPYSFGLRRHGTSKAGLRQGLLLFKSFFS